MPRKLQGFDAYMRKTLKDWNAPGVGVGIVVDRKLVFAKGYGYREYERRLPFTASTLFPIASNTKLFTAVAAGLLVNAGRLTWDKPVRDAVPGIRFHNDALNNTVTLRDMLSHRTGITRHDMIWYKSDFTRKELFDRLRYLEPTETPREKFLYNNMMYAAVGHIIGLRSGMPWEKFVRERILRPLGMKNTVYTVADMLKSRDHAAPSTEKRDTMEIYKLPYYETLGGMAPAGSIISNIRDLCRWLIALMNDGKYAGKQVLPSNVLKTTLEPAIALPNLLGETKGFWEMVNDIAGLGRVTSVYRGHLLTYHGGTLDGFHSQVSFMPQERIGVIVFVIGDHCAPLRDVVSHNVFERLLGMDQTPWSERWLDVRLKAKREGTEARAKAGAERIPNTTPSHPLADYPGEYEHPAYGILKIGLKDGQLQFDFHKLQFPMSHFHYDRFDTPDDEHYGKWSVGFRTNPQGDVAGAVMSLDQAEVVFTRRPKAPSPRLFRQLAGTYVTKTGFKLQVVLKADRTLYLTFPGNPDQRLIPYKGLTFSTPEFSDHTYEFVVSAASRGEGSRVTALKHRNPSGEYVYTRK